MWAQHSLRLGLGVILLSLLERKIGSATVSAIRVEDGQGNAFHNRQGIKS